MRLHKILTTPLLLRRLVRSHERIAQELTLIRQGLYYQYGLPGPTEEEYPADDTECSYSTDEASWAAEVADARRAHRAPEHLQ